MTYTTKDIVEIIAHKIKTLKNGLLDYQTFDVWRLQFEENEYEFQNLFPEEVHKNFPLNDDVKKLIIKELFSVMPFSKSYILKNYEKTLHNLDYLVFPAKQAKRLVILFSGLSGHKTYNRFSWYWDETEKWDRDTVYLFLNDLSEHWYVGTEAKPLKEIYVSIIQSVLNEYDIKRENTFTIGGSMGGYGALFFAIDMGLKGAIAIHPQVTYKSTRKHRVNDWETKIRECGSQFYDLNDMIFKRSRIPLIYLEYGLYEADREAAEKLISATQKRQSFTIIRRTANPDHVTNNPSKMTIDNVIYLFENSGFNDEYIK